MDNRKRGLDVEVAAAAFKRAAEKAMTGTREERSGRFVIANHRQEISKASGQSGTKKRTDIGE
jgi:hypothetical protein